jgi:hypothetical protein
MDQAGCNHVWVANNGQGGEPRFRPNSMMSAAMPVMCRLCQARTWFSEDLWLVVSKAYDDALERARIVRLAAERGDLVRAECGFYVYWPMRGMGAVAAHELRYLADELDRLNAPWQAEIDKYFSEHEASDHEQRSQIP